MTEDIPRILRQYRSSRDLFRAARDAVGERGRMMERIKVLESARLPRGVSFDKTPAPSRAAEANGAASVAFLDASERMRSRVDHCDAVVDAACAVLYGDGDGGIAKLLTAHHADVIFLHYLADATWDSTADAVGVSRSTAIRKAAEAMEFADGLGIAKCAEAYACATAS